MQKKIRNKMPFANSIHFLKMKLRGENKSALDALNNIKKSKSDELFDLYRTTINKEILEKLTGKKKVESLQNLLTTNGMLYSTSLANEVLWAISTCILYKDELKFFIERRNEIEEALLSNDESCYNQIISEVRDNLGVSYWLLENSISGVQHWAGNDAKREFVRELRAQCIDNNLVGLLITYISKRVEGTSIPGYLQSELSKHFTDPDARNIFDYYKAKLFDMNNLSFEQIPVVLTLDFKCSIVDLYESLISVLRWLAINEDVLIQVKHILAKPILVLFNALKDERLFSILISLSIDFDFKIDKERKDIIENYTSGDYAKVSKLSKEYFSKRKNLNDFSLLFICLKSDIKEGVRNKFPGILNDISKEIYNVLMLGDESYPAALTLNAINDKFKTHTWSVYMRIAVMNELSVQDFSSSLDYIKDLYVLETRISPFSFFLSDNYNYISTHINNSSSDFFKLTKELLKLSLKGKFSSEELKFQISPDRYLKYLGRYYLVNNDYKNAILVFEEALSHTKSPESLKCKSALIISYLRYGYSAKAISLLINTFMEWSATPTALPFEEIINNIEDPEYWPSTIDLPLTLALYTNYIRNDKLAHLRYAFEKFNLDNNIKTPQDLKSVENITDDHIKLYLQLVWRPEIMGQTLLYNGSRDIEEARIQVCKLLVDIDPINSSEYQMEIRERVKNLELAKVTKLVDQSRVYVDVSTIKKTLKNKLGDIYLKYKNTLVIEHEDKQGLVEVIEDVFKNLEEPSMSFSNVLSTFHVLGEEDMQFAAIFSEIVNEFLLGEHGLNAYLSTRVRHGKFSNAIRKPIADEHLITELSEGTGNYTQNTYWIKSLSNLNELEKENVLSLLIHFGKKIDEIISYVRDDLIQVAIHDELKGNIANRKALFVYKTSSLERVYAKAKLSSLNNIDEFIDFCIAILWEKTDDNLAIVKETILGNIKTSILSAFDKLSESLGQLGYQDRLGELPNHIARAKTNIQNHIMNVSSWFTRNEVYDRPDHTPDFPVLIAKKMVTNLISGTESWDGVKIVGTNFTNNLPGRTLDSLVDIYCALFENAIEHSGLPLKELYITVEPHYENNKFNVIVCNSVLQDASYREKLNKIELIRQEISKKDTRAKAQKERGSGFHKIWSTINSPLFKNPNLFFSYMDGNKFQVTISFNLESIDEQNTNH